MHEITGLQKATERLIANHQTIAIAESVTAGLIQHAFSLLENTTEFFEGGITAYTFTQKCTHLFIDPVHAIECNCVSKQVAEEMALGVSRSFTTDWGIAITGYAAPVPDLNIDKLYACIAISYAGRVIVNKVIHAEADEPVKVQEFYRDALLDLLTEYWLKLPVLAGKIR